MHFEMFKFSLLYKLGEFKKATDEVSFDAKDFDAWFEEFLIFLDYTIEDSPNANSDT